MVLQSLKSSVSAPVRGVHYDSSMKQKSDRPRWECGVWREGKRFAVCAHRSGRPPTTMRSLEACAGTTCAAAIIPNKEGSK